MRWRVILCAVAFVACASGPPAKESWETALTGTWGWVHSGPTCKNNPHQISFSSDRMFMDLKHAKTAMGERGAVESEARYRIISQSGSALRMQIEGETRKTDTGSLVVWDLVLRGEDEYCWRRADWPYRACTAPIRRCE